MGEIYNRILVETNAAMLLIPQSTRGLPENRAKSSKGDLQGNFILRCRVEGPRLIPGYPGRRAAFCHRATSQIHRSDRSKNG